VNLLKKYELVFIIKPMEEEATQAVIAKFEALVTEHGGEIEKIDRWGKRRLAYPIKDLAEGYYCIFRFTGKPETVAELNRVMKITDAILRHMIVKEDE
jgi:small subunit ribosomal protein S6